MLLLIYSPLGLLNKWPTPHVGPLGLLNKWPKFFKCSTLDIMNIYTFHKCQSFYLVEYFIKIYECENTASSPLFNQLRANLYYFFVCLFINVYLFMSVVKYMTFVCLLLLYKLALILVFFLLYITI